MSSALAKYAERAVPRYTSYPTAPHFTAKCSETIYRDWLVRLDPDEPISLYLHVPFCRQMCWYCGCNMKLAGRYGPISDYVRHLFAEIDLVAEALPTRMSVKHLHLGGGTPTVLSPEDLAALISHLNDHFRLTADTERAIESDPRTLTGPMMRTIGSLGFTRVSFGVQEFDPTVQAAINRIQPPEMVTQATAGLRAAGVRGINFDLIYGLPHQTTAAIHRTVEQCAEMQPDRIALFGYAHVPWLAKNQRMISADALPGAAERAAQAEDAANTLVARGYVRIGIDHFALPGDALALAAANGTLRRNFQGYTSDSAQTLIGIGATAIGYTPQGFVQNVAETGAWSRAVMEDRLPVARGHAMDADDSLRAHVIERIMCDGYVDLKNAGRAFEFSESWYADEMPALAKLADDGIILCANGRLSLTKVGLPLARVVAAVFDTYLSTGTARHSAAV